MVQNAKVETTLETLGMLYMTITLSKFTHRTSKLKGSLHSRFSVIQLIKFVTNKRLVAKNKKKLSNLTNKIL